MISEFITTLIEHTLEIQLLKLLHWTASAQHKNNIPIKGFLHRAIFHMASL